MFKRFFKGNNNGKFSFKRWFKGVFEKKPKVITPRPRPAEPSIIEKIKHTLGKKKSTKKVNKALKGMDAKQLMKQFSISGSQAKILDTLAADYTRGKRPLPYSPKHDARSTARNVKDARKKASILKKRYSLTRSEGNDLEKLFVDIHKQNGPVADMLKNLCDPKKLTKDRVDKLISQYEEGQRKHRGPSYMLTKSNLSLVGINRRVSNLMEDLKGLSGLSGMIRKYQ